MAKKYRIRLSPEKREHLQSIVKADKAASKRQRAQILLTPDASKERGELRDEDVAKVPDVSIATVECTHCALCEHGLEVVAHGWPPHRKVTRTKLDGWAEAHLAVATYSPPPKGAARFPLKLLGDHLVGLGLVDCLSNPHIGRPLKERSETGAGGTVVPAPPPPPQGSAAFVYTLVLKLTAARVMKSGHWCALMNRSAAEIASRRLPAGRNEVTANVQAVHR